LVRVKASTRNYRDPLTIKGGYGSHQKFPLMPVFGWRGRRRGCKRRRPRVCAGLTAWSAVVKLGGVKAGQTVLTQSTGGIYPLSPRPDFRIGGAPRSVTISCVVPS